MDLLVFSPWWIFRLFRKIGIWKGFPEMDNVTCIILKRASNQLPFTVNNSDQSNSVNVLLTFFFFLKMKLSSSAATLCLPFGTLEA